MKVLDCGDRSHFFNALFALDKTGSNFLWRRSQDLGVPGGAEG